MLNTIFNLNLERSCVFHSQKNEKLFPFYRKRDEDKKMDQKTVIQCKFNSIAMMLSMFSILLLKQMNKSSSCRQFPIVFEEVRGVKRLISFGRVVA